MFVNFLHTAKLNIVNITSVNDYALQEEIKRRHIYNQLGFSRKMGVTILINFKPLNVSIFIFTITLAKILKLKKCANKFCILITCRVHTNTTDYYISSEGE